MRTEKDVSALAQELGVRRKFLYESSMALRATHADEIHVARYSPERKRGDGVAR
jgi:hypothetical protein